MRSSHSSRSTSRWFVGSSRSSRSGSPARARASEARVSSPPENVSRRRSSSFSANPSPRSVASDFSRQPYPRRARGGPAPRSTAASSPRRGRRPPSPTRADGASPPARRDRERRRARTRAATDRARAVAAGRAARPASPCRSELPAVHSGLAGEHPEQRRLAGAVRPGEREPLAPLDLEGNAVEEQPGGELLTQVGSDHDGHAAAQVTAWPPPRSRPRRSRTRAGARPACRSGAFPGRRGGVNFAITPCSASAARTASPSPPSGQWSSTIDERARSRAPPRRASRRRSA